MLLTGIQASQAYCAGTPHGAFKRRPIIYASQKISMTHKDGRQRLLTDNLHSTHVAQSAYPINFLQTKIPAGGLSSGGRVATSKQRQASQGEGGPGEEIIRLVSFLASRTILPLIRPSSWNEASRTLSQSGPSRSATWAVLTSDQIHCLLRQPTRGQPNAIGSLC